MSWVYALSRAVVAPTFATVFRMRIVGTANIPDHGGFVLVSNHQSYFDPLFLGVGFSDTIHYLAKRELFKGAFLRWFFTAGGQILVDRANPGGAPMTAAITALKEGRIIGMFPEGTVTMDGRMLTQFKTGAVRLAIEARVPILPVSMSGPFQVLPKFRHYPTYHRVRVCIGKPFSLEAYYGADLSKDDLSRLTTELMGGIARMKAHDDLLLGIQVPLQVAGGLDLPN